MTLFTRWHALSREEQGGYYERAREEKVQLEPYPHLEIFHTKIRIMIITM